MQIIADTREQTPYQFATITPRPDVVRQTLQTGDYSLIGFEDRITIERKSKSDLFSSLGKGRKRFIRELERMQNFNFAAILIEANWHSVLRQPPTRSKMNPVSVYVSLIAFAIRYGIHCWPCENRAMAERTCYRMLERYWKDHHKGIR